MIHSILSVTWDVSPEIFTVGKLTLRYYGVLFVLGFILGLFMLRKFFRRESIPSDEADILIVLSFFIAVISARLGHVIFYEPAYYIDHPGKIFRVWQGGVSSHGGLIGLLLFLWYYAHRKKWNYLWLLDKVAIPGALGAAFIRIGNLMNSEIYGTETNLPWGFIFVNKGETAAKHPTQIYEALAYSAVFLILLLIYNRKGRNLKKGFLSGLFLILLFSARFLIEFVKGEQTDFEASMILKMGQILSIPCILGGMILVFMSVKKAKVQT